MASLKVMPSSNTANERCASHVRIAILPVSNKRSSVKPFVRTWLQWLALQVSAVAIGDQLHCVPNPLDVSSAVLEYSLRIRLDLHVLVFFWFYPAGMIIETSIQGHPGVVV